MELEKLVPLFRIFLHSPAPEGEASVWLSNQSHPLPLASAFISQLLAPAHVITSSTAPSTPPTLHRCLWMQTLPCTVQSRILSFLAIESHRFCYRSLHCLATQILSSIAADGDISGEQFWVHRSARHLLDEMVQRGLCTVGEMEVEKDGKDEGELEFDSVPQWLKTAAAAHRPAFPWLPLSPGQLQSGTMTYNLVSDDVYLEDDSAHMDVQDEILEELGKSQMNMRTDYDDINPIILEKAAGLKDEILSIISPSDAIRVCRDIRHICIEAGKENGWKSCTTILEMIEPWEAKDDLALVLLLHLSEDPELNYPVWPSHVFAAIVIPKLLNLQQPASRALVSSCTDFCNNHPKLVASTMLFPLIYRKEGINAPLCDVLSKVMKEMRPSHVSSFCHRLLCAERTVGDFACLCCHLNMISNKLSWTESLFSLFQNILSWDAPLIPETISKLVSAIEENLDNGYSKSLKFGKLLLCLVTKSAHAVKFHRDSLMEIARKTDTFLTKSIVAKLED